MCVLTPGETDIDEAPGCAPITTLQSKGVRKNQSVLVLGGGTKQE